MRNHTAPATTSARKRNGSARVLLAGCLFAIAALSGCSQPAASSVGSAATEVGRGIAGYNDTQYVYPVRVPDTNQIVEMRVSKPLAKPPTYEDYLKWKENN